MCKAFRSFQDNMWITTKFEYSQKRCKRKRVCYSRSQKNRKSETHQSLACPSQPILQEPDPSSLARMKRQRGFPLHMIEINQDRNIKQSCAENFHAFGMETSLRCVFSESPLSFTSNLIFASGLECLSQSLYIHVMTEDIWLLNSDSQNRPQGYISFKQDNGLRKVVTFSWYIRGTHF